MEFSAEQIAELVGGVVVGDPSITVNNISKIEEGKPGTICFLANPKYNKYVYETKASIVLINKSFEPEKEIKSTLIKVDDAYSSVAKLMRMYTEMKPRKTGIEQPSYISESSKVGDFPYVGAFAYIGDNVTIGDSVSIYPNAYIGDNVTIGDNVIIYAGAKVYHDCKIGNNCIIHAGAVIGADGFGFAPNENNQYDKIPQLGNVVIEDDVEIGANTAVDRATMGSTTIKRGVKLDNMVQIAHNVSVGENTVIAALTGVAGSSVIGDNCMFGGHCGVGGHIKIANNVKMGAFTATAGNVRKEGTILRGAPAFDASAFGRSWVGVRNLPKHIKDIEELKKEISLIKKQK